MYTLISFNRLGNPQPILDGAGNPTGEFSEYINVIVNDGVNDITLTVKNKLGESIPFSYSIVTDTPEQINILAEIHANNYLTILNS